MSHYSVSSTSRQGNNEDELNQKQTSGNDAISQELTKLLDFGVILCDALDIRIVQPVDLAESAALSDIFFDIFMYLSKISSAIENNDEEMQSSITQQYSEKSVTFGDQDVSIIDFVKNLKDEQHVPVFDYTIATPLMNTLCLFELVFKETALGYDVIVVRESSGRTIRLPIDSFSLNSFHWGSLAGLTFPPARKAGSLRTLGPLTLAISLVMEKQNQDLVREAFCDSISYLDDSKKLTNWFATATKAELGDTLSMLGKVLVLSSFVKQTHQVAAKLFTFPILAFLMAYKQDASVAKTFDFSGPGAYHLYGTIARYSYSVTTKETNQNKIKQSIFHGIFGTSLEDLGILSDITDEKFWFNRIELDDTYKNGESTVVQGLPLITKFSPLVNSLTPIRLAATSKLRSGSCEETSSTLEEIEHFLSEKCIKPMLAEFNKMVEVSTTISSGDSSFYEAIVWNKDTQQYEYDKELDFVGEETNDFFYNPRAGGS